MANPQNENPNWTLNIPPLAGVTPFDPTRVRPESGPYPVIITSSSEYTKQPEGSKTIKFSTKIQEGKFKDATVDIYMGFDKIMEEGSINQKAWAALLISLGIPPQVLAQPNQIGPNTFAGKKSYIFVQNAPEGEKNGRDNRNFVTLEQYATLVAQQQQRAAQAGSSTMGAPKLGTPAGTPPPAFGVPQPQGTLASPGGALAGAGMPAAQNGVTQLMPATAPGAVPAAAPAPAGGVTW